MLSFTGQMKIRGGCRRIPRILRILPSASLSFCEGIGQWSLHGSSRSQNRGGRTPRDGFLDTVQSGEAHPVETVDQSDLFGMGDLERFGSQIVPLVDPYGGGFETQRCATVEYGDETLDLQRDQIAEDAEIPEVAVLVGYDEIQSYHPVQTPFHIHAPDVLER